ncbi:MAG: PhoU family transcriptional regulator [Thaumarchaeota archaeon 13_1_40CM_3_50_5]|nr:MAG: PhoU family transcriptional regulator [Thaumarchaeota archaeon 13_1_40CM_4_48_7]OLC26511.1 MAG: PhoU family transcriptional regulator [Candidatus Nitrososphaera sp. 13_1_40CM_48_12]OLC80642.1 MAG: PhoU family transcriptional regulator [Thaumarchaeota archaeon 13_1_40CM_3_50_5]
MLQGEETRKLQYTGGSSYIVSLPKKWIQDLGLKQGDHVVILRQGNSMLQIAPASKRVAKEQREATIEVSKENNPYFIARKLIALYFLGFNVITIVPKEDRLLVEQREVIKSIVRRVLMGTEIIADSATGITLQVLINLLDLSVDAAFKRMLLIAKSMYRDTLLALQENNVELAGEVVKSDDEVDRFSFYIVRQLKIAINNEHLLKEIGLEEPRNCLGYRLIAKSVERVADHAVVISKDIIENPHPLKKDIVEKIASMSYFALEVLDDACLSMFKRDYEAADKAIEKARKIDEMEKAILRAVSKPRDVNELYRIKLITENIRRVAEYASDIAEIVLNMTVQRTLRKG